MSSERDRVETFIPLDPPPEPKPKPPTPKPAAVTVPGAPQPASVTPYSDHLIAAPPAPGDPSVSYRPTRRPRSAWLIVHDDGKTDGEIVRLRADAIVIGRDAGGIALPHDPQVSGRHAEVSRTADGRWQLLDLGSTNGTFARVGRAQLASGREFLVGDQRFRFEAPATPAPPTDSGSGTKLWQLAQLTEPVPQLLEVNIDAATPLSFALTRPDVILGSDPGPGGLAVPGDRFLSPRHVRIARDQRLRWHVEDLGSKNGLWVRVQKVTLEHGTQFQLGEQRFTFKSS